MLTDDRLDNCELKINLNAPSAHNDALSRFTPLVNSGLSPPAELAHVWSTWCQGRLSVATKDTQQ